MTMVLIGALYRFTYGTCEIDQKCVYCFTDDNGADWSFVDSYIWNLWNCSKCVFKQKAPDLLATATDRNVWRRDYVCAAFLSTHPILLRWWLNFCTYLPLNIINLSKLCVHFFFQMTKMMIRTMYSHISLNLPTLYRSLWAKSILVC